MDRKHRQISVLLVCLGNICRSPMAEGALREAAEKAGLEIRVDSAGTAAYHIGDPPDPRAVGTAKAHGVNIASLRARQLSDADFETFTHIIALDRANMAGIKAHAPRHGDFDLSLLLDALEGHEGEPVPDPYYGDDEGFEECWQVITKAVDALVAKLSAERG